MFFWQPILQQERQLAFVFAKQQRQLAYVLISFLVLQYCYRHNLVGLEGGSRV
jgi:hypothetical protein